MQDQVLSDKLSSLKEKIEGELKEMKNSKELYEFKNLYLEGKKSKISELMKEMGKLAPVSYTHLDVYKRQHLLPTAI